MHIEQTTKIIFDADKEYEDAKKFEENHPDWYRHYFESTKYITYMKIVNLMSEVNK